MKITLPKTFFKFLIAALLFVGQFAVGQTTVTHTFSATSGSIDSNISFTTAKNSGTTAPAFNAGLRLYYDSAAAGNGGSITLQSSNGAIITKVKVTVKSGQDPLMKYNVDGGPDVSLSPVVLVYEINGINASSSLKMRNANSTNKRMDLLTIEVTYTVPATVPPIVADQTVNGNYQTPFNYQIVATNSPNLYTIVGSLPAGLSLDTATGIIYGTPTIIGTSAVTVTAANNSGTSTPAATLTFNISKANQTISFTTPATKVYGDANFNLAATTASGLAISFESSNSSVATISGSTVTIVGVGTTNITATQVGNDNYNAAAPITQQFTVTAKSATVAGVTANNKVEDGTTTASLSGTPELSGVLTADVADVMLAGVPVANFATATVGIGKVVIVSGYTLTGTKAENYTIVQPTGLTANITALGTPVATTATVVGSNSFTANWDEVADATGYKLDVSTSSTFGTATSGTLTEGFESTTFPPTGWTTTGWIRSTTPGDINSGTGAAIANTNSGTLTTTSVPNPTSLSFLLGRSGNNSGKTLTIEVSTTSQTTGFTAVETYNNSDVPSGSYEQFTVDLSAYSAEPVVYVRFTKTSSTTSPWRLDDIVINFGTSNPDYLAGYENLSVGDVTSQLVSGLDPVTTYFYRVRAVSGTIASPNSNVIDVTTADTNPSVIWDGTAWSNTSGPDGTTDAIIEGPYSTSVSGIFTAKSLTINTGGSLNIGANTTITVFGALNNTLTAAAVVVENNGNLIQGGSTNMNTGAITVKRNSSALMRQDYTLWSSPTSGAQTLLNFSPATVATRFYTYNPANDVYVAQTPSTTTFDLAKAYLIRVPNTHPITPTIWTGSFVGTPNSGDISYTLGANTGTEAVAFSYNAIGNPYPSPISATTFLDNTNNASSLTGTLYFWRKTNGAGNETYSTYNKTTGFSGNGDAQVFDPNGVIQTGQGFIAETVGAGTGTATAVFTDNMRVDNHANQFFKTNDLVERNRIWLNATNADGLFSQTLVGYVTNASDALDRADGSYMNDGAIALTSIIDDTVLAIQGKSLPFQATDVVALQFKATDAGTYTIAIDHVDGLFTENQAIYLRDALTGAEHDLKAGAYTFASEAGTFADRFNLAYSSLLSVNNSVLDANAVVVYKNDQQSFVINSGNAAMQTVKVFDIRGRLLTTQNNINATQTTIAAGQSNEVLLIQITSVDGAAVTKKVVR